MRMRHMKFSINSLAILTVLVAVLVFTLKTAFEVRSSAKRKGCSNVLRIGVPGLHAGANWPDSARRNEKCGDL